MLSRECRALLHVLDSNVPTREDALRQITTPTLVASSDRDGDLTQPSWPRSCEMPDSYACRGHENALAAPELAAAMAAFLAER